MAKASIIISLLGFTSHRTVTWTPTLLSCWIYHDDVIKWKHFLRYWPFVWGIHRSPHKGQWRGALVFSLICAWKTRWVNNGQAGDLRRYCVHYDVIVMFSIISRRWEGAGNRNPSWWKAMAHLFYMINSMAGDALATQGARTSAGMVLTQFARNIPVSAPEE